MNLELGERALLAQLRREAASAPFDVFPDSDVAALRPFKRRIGDQSSSATVIFACVRGRAGLTGRLAIAARRFGRPVLPDRDLVRAVADVLKVSLDGPDVEIEILYHGMPIVRVHAPMAASS